ncbi:hypothetical protein MTR_8g074290 [Medicago truncatula]|uniref:Uncharacterized protein n=1 Tax=Medicago truncatula TaxID=3880 RepID=G7LA73_MEDTR|nr:hypothetical protein MTR_8g074290 [Medicago truncatula]
MANSENELLAMASSRYSPRRVVLLARRAMKLLTRLGEQGYSRGESRCRKYYLQGPKKGRIGEFSPDLPGMPDNVHYVGKGQYFIGTSITSQWELLLRYPFLRKTVAMVTKHFRRPKLGINGGVIVVDLAGKVTDHYYDLQLSLISSGIKVDN